MDARKIIELADSYGGLPFAERWLCNDMSLFKVRVALKELREREIIYDYPVLREVGRGVISQAEHTVIIKDKPVVTTR
jgi:methionyl aminopeptidase